VIQTNPVPIQSGETPPPNNQPYTKESAAQYQKQVEGELGQLQRDLATLKDRAKNGSAELRAKLQPTIDALEKQSEAARQQLAQLRQQSGAAWQAARPGLDRALSNLREAFHKAAEQFKK
jgi:hypothetical protein